MTVIDVRTEAEWNTGHLEGALHIEWQEILKISSDIKINIIRNLFKMERAKRFELSTLTLAT